MIRVYFAMKKCSVAKVSKPFYLSSGKAAYRSFFAPSLDQCSKSFLPPKLTKCMIAFRLPWTLAIRLLVGFVIAALPCLSGRAHENFRNFPVSAYGAIGDGQHDDTSAIQSAIYACAAAGGGTVLLASGTYVSGPLYLKSNVNFDVQPQAVLQASSDHTEFGESANANTSSTGPSLLNAENQENISITGGGTIDGNGASWWALVTTAEKALPIPLRPKLIFLSHCDHVVVAGITLQNSPCFHLVPFFCNDVLADRVTIHAPSNSPNTDGIDPICSHDVVISNCTIDTGDDDISVKTDGVVDPDAIPDPTADASHILITGCTILHGHGLSIGSVTTGGIHDVLAENCTFQDTENGLRIKSGRDRGGKVQRILYRNMTMQNVLYSRARSVG
jgi:polygalacturonase